MNRSTVLSPSSRTLLGRYHPKAFIRRLKVDKPLLVGLILLCVLGLFILYSAGGQNFSLLLKQGVRLVLAFGVMVALAQIPPHKFRFWAPWVFLGGVLLLVAVLIIGHIGKGAQRWLGLGGLHFQPSEVMKLAIPLMLAWWMGNRDLPPRFGTVLVAVFVIAIPVLLTAKQPDLGTALVLAVAGGCVLLLSGISWRWIGGALFTVTASLPVLWHFMHGYQRQRVITFFNPESDPLGSGYHIIQSKIAVGSGGLFGKGWLNGSQSHLDFLPEHATDFIFAVSGEELGLIGSVGLLLIYFFIVSRCLYISSQARDNFTRLLAGGITLLFFMTVFINVGMVLGILPVVGLPLPLVSYGGTSMVTTLALFGVLMSIMTHRQMISS